MALPPDRIIGGVWHTAVPTENGFQMVPTDNPTPPDVAAPPAPAPNPLPPMQPPAPPPQSPMQPPQGGIGNWIGGLTDLDQIQDPAKRAQVEARIRASQPGAGDWIGGLEDMSQISDPAKRQQVAETIRSVNPSDFFDWQTAQADVLRNAGATEPQGGNYGLITGGPGDRPSYGGGAIWNTLQAAPTGPAMSTPMRATPYQGGGIDPNFGNAPFDLNLPPPGDPAQPPQDPLSGGSGLPGGGGYVGGLTNMNQIQDPAKQQIMADAIAARLRGGIGNPLAPVGGAGDSTLVQ